MVSSSVKERGNLMAILGELEGMLADIPEGIGKALSFLGSKIDELGQELQALAEKVEKKVDSA